MNRCSDVYMSKKRTTDDERKVKEKTDRKEIKKGYSLYRGFEKGN